MNTTATETEVSSEVRSLSAAWSDLAAFASAVDAALGKWLTSKFGISLSDYRALGHLSSSSAKELRVNELAEKTGLNQSSATRLLGRLETRSLAYRDTCPDDGRGIYAVISDDGESLLKQVQQAHDSRIHELLTEVGKHFPNMEPKRVARAMTAVSDVLAP